MFRTLLPLLMLLLAGQPLPPLPETPRKAITDVHHGVAVTDEYRWLEKTDDPAVRKWIETQNRHARAALDRLPALKPVRERLGQLDADPAPSFFVLQPRAGRLFALKREQGKEQPYLVVLESADKPDSARVLVDPNALDPKGKTTIDFYTPSADGTLVAVSLSEGGSEEGTLRVFEVATGKKRPDIIPRICYPTAGGCIAWDADAAGFCYTRYPRGKERPKEDHNFYQQVYHHKLGESTDQDTYVLGKDFPRIAEIFLDRSDDGQWLLATVQKGDGREFEHHLQGSDGQWKLFSRYADETDAIAFGRGEDKAVYYLSLDGAPRGKILRGPLLKSDSTLRSDTVVPEGKTAIVGLDWQQTRMIPRFVPTPGGLFVLEVDGGPSRVRFFPRKGGDPVVVPLPDVSSVNEMVPLTGDEVLLNVETFTAAAAWYAYKKGDATLRRSALSPPGKGGWDDIEVDRQFATSRDGTRIPMTLLYRKGLKKDGGNPTLLYAYGGYSWTLAPHFDATRRLWLEKGGVCAIANLRGGGEYGEEWHRAAMLTKRQNAYDDFFACARLLIDAQYTNPKRLAIEGGSNGGLLMGVALTQHPELFRAVVAHVGLYDMLRFEIHPNGAFNTSEYGSVKNAEQFKALHAYSPLHHVKDGTAYPAVLMLAGANDGRVDPSHSYKMAARLQAATSSGRPVLLRVSFDSGHGLGDSHSAGVDRRADVYAFLFEQLGVGQ
jgi:prolyl oligopeptidase